MSDSDEIRNPPDLSIVVPFFDEKDSIAELVARIEATLEDVYTYEILLVNDGSRDGSAEIANCQADLSSHLRVLHLKTNSGKAAALDLGFQSATGQVIVTMDADLQDAPEEIPKLLKALDDGYDVVSGWKKERKDPLDRRILSKVFNLALNCASGARLHDHNCGFKAYCKEALEGLYLYGDMHRYIPVLLSAKGYRVTEIPVAHSARKYGNSKYGLERISRGLLDLLTVIFLTRFQRRPMHFFGTIGILLGLVGMTSLGYLSFLWFTGQGPIGTRPLLAFGVLCVISGIQILGVGLLAEFILASSNRRKREQPFVVYQTRHQSGQWKTMCS